MNVFRASLNREECYIKTILLYNGEVIKKCLQKFGKTYKYNILIIYNLIEDNRYDMDFFDHRRMFTVYLFLR